jgi:hypothetical protein
MTHQRVQIPAAAGTTARPGRSRPRAGVDTARSPARTVTDGSLKVNTGNGFVPSHEEAFSVLLYHSRSGMFGTLSGSPAYTVSYTATAGKVAYP